jgi:hypothetical protein
MRPRKHKWLGWIGLLVCSLSFGEAAACNVPVFRYALERWQAEPYTATVFWRGPLTAEQKALVMQLSQTAEKDSANLTLEQVDVSAPMAGPARDLWRSLTNPPLPWVVLRYPAASRIAQLAWSGHLSAESLRRLATSPVRRELANRLRNGESAVWLFLEGGNKGLNDAAGNLLEQESKALEKKLRLPEASPFDPPARLETPLKIAFSLLRIERHDPAEQVLVSLLVSPAKELQESNEPIALAVFGRGRALPPLVGREIQAPAIAEMLSFVTSACSCEAKSLNPGLDLLVAAEWEIPGQERLVKDTEVPALTGMSQLASTASNRPVVVRASPTAGPQTGGLGMITRNLLFGLGLGVLVLGIGTLLLRSKL